MIQPQLAKRQMANLSGGPYVLAAAYQGTFPSAYGQGESAPTRMVAAGDGDFLNASLIGRQAASQNVQFVMNAVDWMAQDEGLLRIRAKTVEPRPLQEVSDAVRPWIKYANMIGPALLVIIAGLIRWRWRAGRTIVMASESAASQSSDTLS